MRIKIFTFNLTTFGSHENGSMEFDDRQKAEDTINEFIYSIEPDYEIVDIKVATYEAKYHNNGGIPSVRVIYTIMYK